MARQRNFIVLALALVSCVLLPEHVSAEDARGATTKVRADGFGEGEGRAAEAAALADAEAAAVELVISDAVGEQWIGKLDAIEAQLHDYVRTSRPIESVAVAGGVEILAEVYVYEAQLRRDIAAVLFRSLPVKPAIVVLLGEQIESYREWSVVDGLARAFFEKRFRDAGFDVIDPVTSTNRYAPEDLLEYQSGTTGAVAAFGRDVGADIVVRGKAAANGEAQAGAQNVDRMTAKVELDVIRPVDGIVLEHFEMEAVVSGPDPAMSGEEAIEDAASRIVQDVLVASVIGFANQPPPDDFIVTVYLPLDGPWLTRVRNGIVDRFSEARLEDLRHAPGVARLRVTLDVDLSALVHGLTDAPFDSFRLTTRRAAGRELELELAPSGPGGESETLP